MEVKPTSPFPAWYRKMSSAFKNFYRTQFLVDIIFHCQDGTIGGHQTLFYHASPLFKTLMKQNSCYNDDNIWHVSLPEISRENIKYFMEALYFGFLPPLNSSGFEKFQDMADLFQIFEPNPINISSNEEDILADMSFDHHQIWSEPQPQQQNSKMEEKYKSPEKEVNLLRIDGKEVFVVKTLDSTLFDTSRTDNSTNNDCDLCSESLEDHKIDLEDDSTNFGNDENEFQPTEVYKCCVKDCSKTFSFVKEFNNHLRKQHKVYFHFVLIIYYFILMF